MRNSTANTRTILRATMVDIGMLSIAWRAAGHVAASAAARSGTITKNPTTGTDFEILSHPAAAAAAARPIQTPNTAASVILAARETSMKVIRVLTISTIKAAVMTVPKKSSMLLLPQDGERGSRTTPLLDGSSANALRRLGSNIRAGSSLRSQLRSTADRSAVACGRAFDRSQHFLGDHLRLGCRVGVV